MPKFAGFFKEKQLEEEKKDTSIIIRSILFEKHIITTKERMENISNVTIKLLVPKLIELMEDANHKKFAYISDDGNNSFYDLKFLKQLTQAGSLFPYYHNTFKDDEVIFLRAEAISDAIQQYRTNKTKIRKAEIEFMKNIPKILSEK